MKRLPKIIGLLVSLLLLCFVGAFGTRSANASNAYDAYWTRRMNRVAAQRAGDHYAQINWNARDLGGYYAGHGYWTRYDKVIRGGDLHNISNAGVQQLHNRHVREVIDLRSHKYQGGMDPQEPSAHNRLGVVYRHYQVNTAQQKHQLYPAKLRYGEIYKYGDPFTTYWHARHAYQAVFNQLLNNRSGAIYFHCIQGRDRTGIMSALYLAALGVSRYQIFNDFLLSNYYKHKYSYHDQSQELNHFYNTVNRNYGSMARYLRYGIGLTNYQLNKLRRKYLFKKVY